MNVSQITNFDSQYSGCVHSREPVSGGGSRGGQTSRGQCPPPRHPSLGMTWWCRQAAGKKERLAGALQPWPGGFMNIREGNMNIYEGEHPRASSAI